MVDLKESVIIKELRRILLLHSRKDLNLQKKERAEKVILYGQSLGGILSLRALLNSSLDKNIDLVVIDSSFDSYQDLAFNLLKSYWTTWVFSPLGLLISV